MKVQISESVRIVNHVTYGMVWVQVRIPGSQHFFKEAGLVEVVTEPSLFIGPLNFIMCLEMVLRSTLYRF